MIRPVREQFPVTDSFERACDGDNAFDVIAVHSSMREKFPLEVDDTQVRIKARKDVKYVNSRLLAAFCQTVANRKVEIREPSRAAALLAGPASWSEEAGWSFKNSSASAPYFCFTEL